jgi:1-acyl-sn-glycerol-3-phosphate acyltransferase
MTRKKRVLTAVVKALTTVLCQVDADELAGVPDTGPLIIVANHVNFLDAPVVFTRLHPRPVTGFAKAETWDTPGLRLLFDIWEAIPVRRGEADVQAIRRGLDALEAGSILGVAPEGTRSGHGRLQRGHGGVVLLAHHSGAPVLPIACYGAEDYRHDWARLRRAEFHVVVGEPFFLRAEAGPARRARRQQITDEIMYQLAALLPPEYRGVYADLGAATETHLNFCPPAKSNLRRARRPVRTDPTGEPVLLDTEAPQHTASVEPARQPGAPASPRAAMNASTGCDE